MKLLLAGVIAIATICLAVWIGIFVMFVPGVEQIVDGFQAEPEADGWMIGLGLVRCLLATTVAGATFWVGGGLVYLLCKDEF